MVTNKQLRDEIKRLKSSKSKAEKEKRLFADKKRQMIIDAKRKKAERLALEKELIALRNPKSEAFRKNVSKAGRTGLKALFLIGEDIREKIKKKAAENRAAENRKRKRK